MPFLLYLPTSGNPQHRRQSSSQPQKLRNPYIRHRGQYDGRRSTRIFSAFSHGMPAPEKPAIIMDKTIEMAITRAIQTRMPKVDDDAGGKDGSIDGDEPTMISFLVL